MSSVADLLEPLNQRGIRLYLEQGELRFKAPKGAMTPDTLALLKTNKAELTALLRQAEASRGALSEPLSRFAGTDEVPLSMAQQRLWFLFKLEGATPTYNILMASRLLGDLDVPRLRRSFEYLIRRHESLRTSFRENDDGLARQVIAEDFDLEMVVEDISADPDSEKQALLEQAKGRMAATRFDLTQAPLSRVRLIRYSHQEWVLLMAMHHIIGDGWSMGILSRELGLAYQRDRDGRESHSEDIAVRYRDYAVWQQRPRQRALIEQGVQRWCELLAGSEYRLDLNTGKKRPESRSYRGSTCPLRLDPTLSGQLERLAESQGVSLFVLLLTAYFILLQRYSGRHDVLVGTQAANRNEPGLEPIVGFFVNTLPLRARIDGNSRVAELLAQVKEFCLKAFDLQYVPFERLVEALKPERDFGSNPLVQIMFLWQNAPIADVALKGLTMQREPLPSEAAKFDLTLELGLEQGRIQGVFEYSTDLYDAPTIENMVLHYSKILQGIVENPDVAVADVRLREPRAGRMPSLAEPGRENLISVFDAQVAKTPEAKALNDGRQVLTYRQLSDRAAALAWRLASAGIRPGAIVAIYLPRGNDYLVALIGILKAGCAYLPLETTLPRARIEFILQDAQVAAVVGRESPFPAYAHIDCRDLPRAVNASPVPYIPAQAPAYLIYTSGSTGQPKGVLISQQSVLGLVGTLTDRIYRQRGEVMNVALMASFIFDASVQQIFAALLQGHCLHICDDEARRDGPMLLAFLQSQAIDLSDCTPTLLQIMLEAGLAERGDLRLRQLIVGGEALPPPLIETIASGSEGGRLEIYNVYGPTECTVDATLHRVDLQRRYAAAAVSIGSALDHAEVEIVDIYGNRQPDGLAGEIAIGGRALALAYWQRPALTAERFVPADGGQRYYRTGDQGRVNRYGEIEFLGRLDGQVKIRGYRIELGEIDAQLLKLPGVLQAVAVVNRGESVEIVAYLVVQAQPSLADLRAGLAKQLPEYMIPAHFVVLERLPVNASGKIDRKALPKCSEAQRLSDELGGAAQGERESLLAQVWCGVLGLDGIGREDNFFASGGDSIKALQIVSRLRQQGWKLEVRDLFAYPSLSRLAPRLSPLKAVAEVLDKAEGELPLTPIQQHFFRYHGCDFHHFNQAFLLETEALDADRLSQALLQVCQGHDAFLLRYQYQDGQWRQFYADGERLAFFEQELPSMAALSVHAAELQKSFDLTVGPLLKAVYYRLPDQQFLLLLAHHLIIDGVSWRILMEELDEAYQQGSTWQAPPQTTSLSVWMQQLRRQGAKIIAEQHDYWRRQTLSPGLDGRDVKYQDLEIVKIEFDKDYSERFLTGVHHAYGTEANDLLLAALLSAYHQWAGDSALSLILEGHGRDVLDDVDLSRTIGWFTTRYPVSLEYPANRDLGYLIKTVKEALRAIPDKGLGYGLVRYMDDATNRHSFQDPAISFNYLGQFGEHSRGRFTYTDENIGAIMSPNARTPYLIEFVGRHAAGRLMFEIAYPRQVYRGEGIGEFAAAFEQALLAIIDHAATCKAQSLTPSDIDYDGFDINQLDDFLAQI
ncbi:non-ribosomal peptide synthetase [Methylomonas sp. UP202]|uniref:non-ribosomal peptide synthetase n=1 Tax=Methylomonas sp. UP202 TaxID=3040943 RepID=UPI002478E68C|nr:non-ribosomal peptide synthetase [Methylomonas sp. UP202]WGS85508.1 amino acid adenylation domain-containing protein [Methylomonas sp. UP202]